MKKLTLLFAFVGMTTLGMQAQRVACVDVVRILESLEDYKKAQAELEATAAGWKQQIDQMRDEMNGMINKYESERVLLSDEARVKREDQIMMKEKEMRDFQKAKFDPNGAFFKKRQELIRPIQDRVYTAIEEFAEQKGFDFIFDKGGSAGLLFTNPRYDKTDDILKKLTE